MLSSELCASEVDIKRGIKAPLIEQKGHLLPLGGWEAAHLVFCCCEGAF